MVNPGRKLKKIILILGIAGAVYGGFQYLLPLVIPFLFAYGAALWLRPSVRYFERRFRWNIRGKQFRLPASVVGGVELFFLFVIIGVLIYMGGSRLISQMEGVTAAIPQILSWLDVKLTEACLRIEEMLGLKSEYLVAVVRELIRDLGTALRQSSMPAIMNNSVNIVSWLAEALIFLVIFFLATLMFLQEMDEIRERKHRSMFHREFALIGRRLVNVGSAWLRAEAMIVFAISILCTIGLFFIGNDYALLFGIGIGLLDALPLFGAGIVLVPWGILRLIQKKWMDGIILLGLYAICYFVRQVLEAKLMGDRIGLTPIETLVSMYVGLKLFGLSGVLLGPIGLLMIEDLVELYWNVE